MEAQIENESGNCLTEYDEKLLIFRKRHKLKTTQVNRVENLFTCVFI